MTQLTADERDPEDWDDDDGFDDEEDELDEALGNCHSFLDGGRFVCMAVGSEECDECPYHSDLGKTVSEVEREMEMSDDE